MQLGQLVTALIFISPQRGLGSMRFLAIVLLGLLLGTVVGVVCPGVNGQGTLWNSKGLSPLNNTPGIYINISINLTNIPCVYNREFNPDGMRDLPSEHEKYIYPKDGYQFMLCYVKIENHGYSKTPSRLDGIVLGDGYDSREPAFQGLKLNPPDFQLLIDGIYYYENNISPSGSIAEFNLSGLHSHCGTGASDDYFCKKHGYIYIKNGEYADGFVVFYIPNNCTQIKVIDRGNQLRTAGISVKWPLSRPDIPADALHELLELNRITPK